MRLAALITTAVLLLSPLVTASAAAGLPCPYMWTHTLKIGSTGPDVFALQQFLNQDSSTALSATGPGSVGQETSHYGTMTADAVSRFQTQYAADILVPNGLMRGTGVLGAATREKLNALCNASTATLPAQSSNVQETAGAAAASNTLSVGDPGQPTSGLAPANSSPDFLSFTLTAGGTDVVVSDIVVQREGAGSDAPFSSLGLYGDDGLQIGNIVTLDANHQVHFRQPFTVPAHTTMHLDVYGNMDVDMTAYDGQQPELDLVSLSASAPVAGPLPLRGSPQTVNASLIIGSATMSLSSYDPGTAMTRYITDTGIRFAGVRITASSVEDLTLSNIIWEQSGTAGPNDVANVVAIINGSSTPAVVRGREYIFFFDPGVVIPKGQTIDIYIQGDLTPTGSNRTVEFDIHDNTDDISLTGNTYNLAVGAVPDGNTATTGHSVFLTDTGDTSGNSLTPFFSGSVTTISPGAASFIMSH